MTSQRARNSREPQTSTTTRSCRSAPAKGVGEIHDTRPAADIIRQLAAGAATLLTTWQAP
ncbi:MAG: hypothetical protein ACLP0J_16830 [Solirubrobacteraceae bacterium]